jgi:hypothetical protein
VVCDSCFPEEYFAAIYMAKLSTVIEQCDYMIHGMENVPVPSSSQIGRFHPVDSSKLLAIQTTFTHWQQPTTHSSILSHGKSSLIVGSSTVEVQYKHRRISAHQNRYEKNIGGNHTLVVANFLYRVQQCLRKDGNSLYDIIGK